MMPMPDAKHAGYLPGLLVTLTLAALLVWSPAAEAVPSPPPAKTVHTVKKGENLSVIARRTGLSVKELKRRNGLTSANLKIGQRLRLDDPAVAFQPLPLPALPASTPGNDGPLGELTTTALSYLKTPYRFGGSSSKGIDCSAFVQKVFGSKGIDLPRTAREQFQVGARVPVEELAGGDLIFFRTYAKYPSHVGIYLGNGKMVHASPRSHRVVVSTIDTPYFRKRFLGARRLATEMAQLVDLKDLPTENAEEDPLNADPSAEAPPPGPSAASGLADPVPIPAAFPH